MREDVAHRKLIYELYVEQNHLRVSDVKNKKEMQ